MRPAPASASGPTTPWMAPPPAPMATSPWHSPVPYLFGGLAAMLGLIALALLILACSYWKLNSYLAADSSSSSADPEGSKSPAVAAAASPAALAGLVAVVMAGEKTPTFLAAPVVRRIADADGTAGEGDGATQTKTEESSGRGLVGNDAGRDRQRDHV